MTATAGLTISRLGSADAARLAALNQLFADAFEDSDTYAAAPPDAAWAARQLARTDIFVLVAKLGAGELVGGLVAYELAKLEQARTELYLYDLAVAAPWRRRGIATALISALADHARATGAHSLYVQADREDEAAVALYARLGTGRPVLHFDLLPDTGS